MKLKLGEKGLYRGGCNKLVLPRSEMTLVSSKIRGEQEYLEFAFFWILNFIVIKIEK